MNIIIRDLDQTRIHFEAAIHRVGEREAKTAFSRAMNDEGDKIRTQVRRGLAKQTGVKYGIVKDAIIDTRSSFKNLTYTLTAKGGHFGLTHFKPSQFKYGVRAKPWGKSQRFEKAFLIKVQGQSSDGGSGTGYNVFTRDSSGCFPVSILWGPSIPVEMLKGESRKAFEGAQFDAMNEATRQIQRIIEGG